jgi:hypothetical protein
MWQINLCRADRWHYNLHKMWQINLCRADCTKEYYWFLKNKLGQKQNDDLITEYLCKDKHSTDNDDMFQLDL